MGRRVNLADTRQRIADTLTSVLPGVSVYPHRPASVRANDGWTVLRSVAPSTFGTCTATFDVLILIGVDEQHAAESLDRLSVALIDAIGQHLGAPITVVPQSLTADGADLYCCTATFLSEVSA
jgi:hypothetical protein